IAWMIERFDSRDPLRKSGLRALNERCEFILRTRRSGDENRSGRGKFLRHAFQEFLVKRHVTTVARICLVMQMRCRIATCDNSSMAVDAIEVEDSRLVMIDPDQRVKVMVHISDPSKL